ncbi:WSC domain-containing protein [Aspergillus lucknowensis]|uniref:WSC domain-containing protein n=1 Tax=Aspergillus lucknowensis TaxID=176173 RepID=A0ABR4LQF4_9EURO
MKSTSVSSVLATSILLLVSSSPAAAQQETYIGCFSSSSPLKDQGTWKYQSNGYCMNLCYGKGYSVFGLHNGDDCLCGDKLPVKSDMGSDDDCDMACAAWPTVMCGGSKAYSVYLTGLEKNVPYLSSGPSTTNSSSSTTKTNGATPSANEQVATSTNSPEPSDKKDGPNTAAIAAGVVIGVVGLAALIGAGFFLWRFKTRHPADKRLREMGTVEQFSKPMSQDSMSDPRFDGDFMAQRRQSNGSIDDDRDFSRRILQVTNPDRL